MYCTINVCDDGGDDGYDCGCGCGYDCDCVSDALWRDFSSFHSPSRFVCLLPHDNHGVPLLLLPPPASAFRSDQTPFHPADSDASCVPQQHDYQSLPDYIYPINHAYNAHTLAPSSYLPNPSRTPRFPA